METSRVVNRVLARYPLFGNIIANLNIEYSTEPVPAPAFTDGKNIYYKDSFFTDYTADEQEFIISHEILHIAFSHIHRNPGRDRDLLNYVEDAIINQYLKEDGLPIPEGAVNVPDALDYSTEELYMKYLPKLNEIKEWMKKHTYHVEISPKDNDEEKNSLDNADIDLNSILKENKEVRKKLAEDYQSELKKIASEGIKSMGITLPSESLGESRPMLRWQDILKASLKSPMEEVTSFYEVEMDGVIRRETKSSYSFSESEIVVDSSISMDIDTVKAILRECKNILSVSLIKVGFCDTIFYGWHTINTNRDIDCLEIEGRGGTSFDVMADSFSQNVDNKIVITDGYGIFPKDRPDILWVIVDYFDPYNRIDENINYVYINEEELRNSKKLSLTKKEL